MIRAAAANLCIIVLFEKSKKKNGALDEEMRNEVSNNTDQTIAALSPSCLPSPAFVTCCQSNIASTS